MQGKKLYIGNITPSVKKEQLRDLFSEYGEVIEIKILGDNAFGFIEMSSQMEAENAKKSLDGYNLEGRNIKVDEARQKNAHKTRNFRKY